MECCDGFLVWAVPKLFSWGKSGCPVTSSEGTVSLQMSRLTRTQPRSLAEGAELRSLLIHMQVSKAQIVNSGQSLLCSHFTKLIEGEGDHYFANAVY